MTKNFVKELKEKDRKISDGNQIIIGLMMTIKLDLYLKTIFYY